jgi:hypothetical protein
MSPVCNRSLPTGWEVHANQVWQSGLAACHDAIPVNCALADVPCIAIGYTPAQTISGIRGSGAYCQGIVATLTGSSVGRPRPNVQGCH